MKLATLPGVAEARVFGALAAGAGRGRPESCPQPFTDQRRLR